MICLIVLMIYGIVKCLFYNKHINTEKEPLKTYNLDYSSEEYEAQTNIQANKTYHDTGTNSFQSGDFTFNSNGISSQKITDDYTFHSDGSTTKKIADGIWLDSDGTISRKISDKLIYHSDGTYTQIVGDYEMHD